MNSKVTLAAHPQYSNSRGYYARMKESGYYSARSPSRFGYRFKDNQGNIQSREEKTDANGVKRGSYSFYDANGIFRKVEYIADNLGFRATVTTNEPGTHHANPANVQMRKADTEPVPSNLNNQPLIRIGQTLHQLNQVKARQILNTAQNEKQAVQYPSKYPSSTQWNGPTVLKRPSLYQVPHHPTSAPIRTSYPSIPDTRYVPAPDLLPPRHVKPSPYTSSLPNFSSLSGSNFEYSVNHDDYHKLKKPSIDLPSTTGTRYKPKLHSDAYRPSTYPRKGSRWPKAKQQIKYGKRANTIVKIHIPLGAEDNQYIPLYRDK